MTSETPGSRPTLTELARKYKTDKWGIHRYTPHYQRHFGHLRDEEFLLFEIGIGGYGRDRDGGASLRMWKEFFPKARIVGLDIQDKAFVNEDRIQAYRGSQVDPVILDEILTKEGVPTLVIDDGSHRPEHVIESFRLLYPRLGAGAVYAIEDIQTTYWPQWGGSLDRNDTGTSMGYVKQLIDGLNHEEFLEEGYTPSHTDLTVTGIHCYHNLVFIEKGENVEGSNKIPANAKWLEANGLSLS